MNKLTVCLATVLLCPVVAFAYDTTNTIGHYTNEQFERDIKSYLDEQQERQQAQDFTNQQQQILDGAHQDFQQIISNLKNSSDDAETQFGIEQLEQQIENSNKESANLDTQIQQALELINQQNSLMAEQKKLDEEKELYSAQMKTSEEITEPTTTEETSPLGLDEKPNTAPEETITPRGRVKPSVTNRSGIQGNNYASIDDFLAGKPIIATSSAPKAPITPVITSTSSPEKPSRIRLFFRSIGNFFSNLF